jgi:hypothetical protein
MGVYSVLIDLTGSRFGRWLVLNREPDKSGNVMWKCVCDCGNIKTIRGSHLKSGRSSSCRCYCAELNKELKTTHNLSKTPLYRRYMSAKGRCQNPNNPKYPDYGGRGIEFLFDSFLEFKNALGDPPSPNHQVDRKDNDGPYSANNVQWATRSQQMRNRRPLSEWNFKD